MWYVVVEALNTPQKRFTLQQGITRIGRGSMNEIVVEDTAASRSHACIEYNLITNSLTVTDLQSTNGTFLNRERLAKKTALKSHDVIRIGQVLLRLENEVAVRPTVKNTHLFTRELVLESVDNHAVILYEVARKLNTVMDVSTALTETAHMVKQFMNVGTCAVILEKDFSISDPDQIDQEMARKAIAGKSAEITAEKLYVPIMSGEEILGLICMARQKNSSNPHYFGQRDLQIAVAISYQAALTIQRVRLLDLVHSQEDIQRTLMQFVTPGEAENKQDNNAKGGQLPELNEEKVTVLFSDIANSSAIAERLGPKEFANMLGLFYRNASQLTFKYGGMIKYLGDGVLSIFPHQTIPLAEQRAVDMGRELIKQMMPTGSFGEKTIIIGVSINTGTVMIGYVGVEDHMEFNVLGEVVNVAFRLQDYARPYKIIVGPETVAGLGEIYKHKRIGAVYLRGREDAVQINEILH